MNVEAVAAVVSSLAAVVSVVFAGISWWDASHSKRAKIEAEAARDTARRSAAALEELVAETRGPLLTLTHRQKAEWLLHAAAPVSLVRLDTKAVTRNLDFPMTLEAGQSVTFLLLPVWDGTPAELVFVTDDGRRVRVPVPPCDV